METRTKIDGAALRTIMRKVPAAVTVVTVAGPDEIQGITIGSFTSVSLDPPLICFNVQRQAHMHPILTAAARYAVHILSSEQAHLSDHFAVPNRAGDEQFAGVPHQLDAYGVPVLQDTLGVIHCVPYAVYEAGDHSILVGEVVDIEAGKASSPVLYFNRAYCRIGNTVQPRGR